MTDEPDPSDLHRLLDGPVGPTAHLASSARRLARRRTHRRNGGAAVLAAACAATSVPLLLSSGGPSDALVAAPGAPGAPVAASPDPMADDRLVADCLQTAGFAVQLESDGYSYTTVDGPHARAYAEAQYACGLRYTGEGVPPATDAQLAQRYDVQLRIRDCLIDRDLPVADAPARADFIADYGSWTPYDGHEGTIGQAKDCDALGAYTVRD